jgi:starch-binding outer membrane protein, SusD/RagB family
MTLIMRLRILAPALMLLAAGCDSILDTDPVDRIPSERAITDAATARAALVGAYDAMQSTSYYGGSFLFFGDLPTDNARHFGTLTAYADADQNNLQANNGTVQGIWGAIYDAISRVNLIIARVPLVTDLDDAERDQILGEAYFLRALNYHNLVKFWGDVPLRLEPVDDPAVAAQIARSPVAEVYAQIHADLDQAQALMSIDKQRIQASIGAVRALRSRVALYEQKWAEAEAEASAVLGMGYGLAQPFSSLFPAESPSTVEDIFLIGFTDVEFQNIGYYYNTSRCGGGRGELIPTGSIDSAFAANDLRKAASIGRDSRNNRCGKKYPTVIGAEDVHVIRLAEVILIKAEAHAMQDELQEAVDEYNKIRVRAGLAPHTLGTEVTTRADVLNEIYLQRRLELAFEGDRFPDLVRRGEATTVLGIPAFRTKFPIPLVEINVAPNITQNEGY